MVSHYLKKKHLNLWFIQQWKQKVLFYTVMHLVGKKQNSAMWSWDTVMFTCPDSISKLLILALPAEGRAAYPDWALPGGCGSAASITSLGLLFWHRSVFLSSDWQRQFPPLPPRAEQCQRSLKRLCPFNPSRPPLTWHLFISAKCSGEEAPLPKVGKKGANAIVFTRRKW